MTLKILEVHQVYKEIENLDLSDFDIFTFDDGLYSQYKNIDFFTKCKKPLYFFISPFYIRENQKSLDFEFSDIAQKNALEKNDKSAFMSLEEIKEISKIKNVHIGGHSFSHKYYKNNSVIDIKDSLQDFNNMIDYFNTNRIYIDSFCYPYNNYLYSYHQKCKNLNLTEFGINPVRIPVESLLKMERKNVWINY